MCRSTLKVMLMAMILVVFSASLFAQQTGTITGTVVDKTGAVISGAKITLTNLATKDIRHTVTNGEGFFSFNAVVTGDYAVKTEYQGFKAREENGVHLSPGDRRSLNIEMAVGKESEHVEVEAAAAEVQVVDSGDRAAVLTTKDIKNLALQGRDVTELVKVLPGFNNTGNGLQNNSGYNPQVTGINSAMGNGYSANGMPNRAGGADLTADGAHVIDPGCNCAATQTINADMVQEVKVSTSTFGADSAKGPVVVQAVGKSGSSEYHGQAYLHFRDASMASWDYNLKQNMLANPTAGITKPKDRYWYPGGSFGGPVPYTNKKLLFWTGYEYYNQVFPDGTTGGSVKASIFPNSMRAGKFDPTLPDNKAWCDALGSGAWQISGNYVCQPITSINLHGQIIPITNSDISAYIQPGAKAILKEFAGLQPNAIPTPNSDYNYVKAIDNQGIGYMFHTRVDYNFSDSTKLYVSYNQQHDRGLVPVQVWWTAGNSVPFPGGTASQNVSHTVSANLVKVFSPTLTNEFVASLGYVHLPYVYSNQKAVDRTANGYPYKGAPQLQADKNMPEIFNTWWANWMGIPTQIQSDISKYYSDKVMPSFSDNLTKVIGKHTLKTGVNWEKTGNEQLNFAQTGGENGTNWYSPIWDGTGNTGCDSTHPKAGYDKDCNLISAYNPMVNFLTDRVAQYNQQPNTITNMAFWTLGFYGQDDWKITKKLTLNLGLRLSHETPWNDNSGKYGMAIWTPERYKADVAKGITNMPGFGWHAKDKSIPLTGRTVQSLFYSPRFGLAYDLFGTGATVLRGGIGAYYYHDQYNDYAGPLGVAEGGTSCTTNSAAWLSDIEANTNNVITCGGLGGSTAVDPHDHSMPLTYTYNFTISQRAPFGSLLEIAYSGNQSSHLQNPLQDQNVIPLGAFFKADPVDGKIHTIQEITANSNALAHDYLPMREFGKLAIVHHGAWANYNALQVSWVKPRGNVNYSLNYTFSKTMGIVNSQNYDQQEDAFNLHNDYGVIGQDRTHVLNATYSYELGNVIKGSKLLGGIVNGWMISGITGIQSGVNLQAGWNQNFGLTGTEIDAAHILGTLGLGGGTYKVMPTLLCDPRKGTTNGELLNSACFGVPTVGHNGVYQLPYMRGPAYISNDLAIQKTFKVTERQNAQFRLSAFNVFNHALASFDQNNNANITLNMATVGTVTRNAGGYITSGYTFQAPAPPVHWGAPNEKFGRRLVELTFKYMF